MDRQTFVQDALSLLGTKYQHQGRDPEMGVDCIGYICALVELQGYKPNYPKAYKRISVTDEIHKYFDKHFEPTYKFLPGNLILFKHRKVYYHSGILLEDGKMIHAINKEGSHDGGVIISSLIEEKKWLQQEPLIYDLMSIKA